ncbi:MAG TPA: endonuclease/exonuclease/phosphatase family protein [Bryobacteraceae bacterium]|nr:endonuclease/exonuclease/phosphatase family protein [Bryobacteraceae bacterium]
MLSPRSLTIFIGLAIGFGVPAHAASSAPPVLSFDDLIALATNDPPPPKLAAKLAEVLTTPVVVNQVDGPHHKSGPLHLAEWNINRGENEEEVELALSNADRFLDLARRNPQAKHVAELRAELEDLQAADVIVLDEVDDGVDRTKYHDVARDLANALHMNYVYGVEFIELDRIYLGAEKMDQPEQATANTNGKRFGLDPTRYRGLEGSAVLSRYPIRSARIVRLPQAYDWYHSEVKAISDLEKARRWSAEQLFEERIARQVRRGGRMALIVDLASPASPTGTITVICPHLEDYTSPRRRREQMQYLLQQCTTIANPAILAGDLNTTGKNGHPLTVERALFRYVLNYHVLIREVVFFITPIPGAGILLRAANYIKNYHDPTAFNVPIFLSNPSKPLFNQVRHFRFADGGRFDFSGSPERSFHQHARTLADSNQRGWKGFTPTFRFKRTFHNLVGEFKLDWIFVKPGPGTTRLIPNSGRTLHNLNYALGQRVSDHSPITVVLSTSVAARALTAQQP